jgi:hypothetical protein
MIHNSVSGRDSQSRVSIVEEALFESAEDVTPGIPVHAACHATSAFQIYVALIFSGILLFFFFFVFDTFCGTPKKILIL